MPKIDPRQWAPPRRGYYWSYEVLRQKVLDLNAAWKSAGLTGEPVWQFSIDRNFKSESGEQEIQILTDRAFFGDDAKDPIPGKYCAETTIEGEHLVWEGIHYDRDARAERSSRGESEGEAQRRSTADQFTRLEHEIARLRREKDQYEDREAKLRRDRDEWVEVAGKKDTEILSLRRERDVAVLDREEMEMERDAAVEEKRQIIEDNEQLKEPLRILGSAIVASGMEYFGVMSPDGVGADEPAEPAAVRAAGNIIVMAVLQCPEAQEVLRLSVDEQGEPLLPIVQEPDVDPIDFVTSYLQEIAAQAVGREQPFGQPYANGTTGHESEGEESEAEGAGEGEP